LPQRQRSRPSITVSSTPSAPVNSDDDDEYEYYYYYYDEDEENGVTASRASRPAPPPLRAIDDYDLNPIINKVING
jgi:hypothetical protein